RNLPNRINETLEALRKFKDTLPDDITEEQANTMLDTLIKDKIDYAFGKGTSKAVFGDVSCLTPANDEGECIFETFMNAIVPIIRADVTQASKNQSRHISDMLDKGKLDKYINNIKGAAP
ncbi:MAG: hypothetical protein II722_06440, partial [Ruminococcus sp.]|nr:hypothetical protein [Ruminococcus sp.]